jgi:galactose mutarotase-like enzyme
MISITNKILDASFKTKGAELRSLRLRENNLEFIWQADPGFWPKSSPLLFPIVGSLKNGSYLHKGTEYRLPRHGFARDREFSVAETSSGCVKFVLESDELTRKIYPFDWSLSVEYSLEGTSLTTAWTVENRSNEPLPFSIGAHPAFRVPILPGERYEDYRIEFERSETLMRGFLDSNGLVTGEQREISAKGSISLRHSLFEKDALIFDSFESCKATIRSEKSPWSVSVEFPGFPFLGIWAAKGADFVCIEPWQGIADGTDSGGEILNKRGILKIKPGDSCRLKYTISVNIADSGRSDSGKTNHYSI